MSRLLNFPLVFSLLFFAVVLIGDDLELCDMAYAQSQPDERIAGDWHRVSPGDPPEHQLMRLHRERGGEWIGRIDKHPEPSLGFDHPPVQDVGIFIGNAIDVAEAVDLTQFFPFPGATEFAGGEVLRAVEGIKFFHFPPGIEPPGPFPLSGWLVPTQLLVIQRERESGLQVELWVVFLFPDRFETNFEEEPNSFPNGPGMSPDPDLILPGLIPDVACPWFRTFDEALAANPSFMEDCLLRFRGQEPAGGGSD